MSILTIIAIFVVGFLILYATYRYGGQYPIVQYFVYVVVILVFLVVLCDISGILPANYLNRKV